MKDKAPVTGLTFTGRRNVVGPGTEKILASGPKPAKKLAAGLLGDDYKHQAKDILSQRFMIPPFSVLNTREGWWQDRKRLWIGIGIQSELGRGGMMVKNAYASDLDGHGGNLRKLYKEKEAMPRKYGDAQGKGLLKPIKTDLRPRDASPGGSPRPAMDYRNRERGDGRGQALIRDKLGDSVEPTGGTSIFDPVLCELCYRWFCPEGGAILDPFAGGSVRGIVAGELGHSYTGIELSERQVEANTVQAKTIAPACEPVWINGDSRDVLYELILANERGDEVELPDMIFSCPPYGDLEKYSDAPNDLSAMSHEDFDTAYAEIIIKSCELLKPHAFAVFVVGDYRTKDGYYRNFPGKTIDAFLAAGLRLYNRAILVTSAGSLPLRVNVPFLGSRKLGNTHQDVLVFAKGNPFEFVKTWPKITEDQ